MPVNGIIMAEIYGRPFMKKGNSKKKIMIFVIILIILAAVLLYLFMKKDNKSSAYKIDAVQMSDIESSISIKGTVRAADCCKIYSDSMNKVSNILVKKGDFVKKDQVIAIFDMEKMQREYDIASIDYEMAKKYYDDTVTLYKSEAVPQSVLYEAEMALKKAVLVLESFDIENAGEILSPIDGVVAEINCEEGGYAAFSIIQQPAFVIEDRSKLELKAEAKEKNISAIYVGQTAEITFDATGDMKVSGKVTEIGPSGKVNQGTGAVMIPVTIEIDDSTDVLMPGISGKAKFTVSEKNAITVSLDALSDKNDETYVYVLKDDNSIEKVAVETGINDESRIQVVSGEIKEGDRVIIDPDAYMFE